MALPSNSVSASPFVGLPVDGGLTAPAHADALNRQTFLHIFGSGETSVSALTPIATPLCNHMNLWIYASVNTGRGNDQ